MGLMLNASVFIYMKTEAYFLAKDYWNNLSVNDKTKLLLEYDFWGGFNKYVWEYLPECLKELIVAKIDSNGLK
jgi:hypothetical protein